MLPTSLREAAARSRQRLTDERRHQHDRVRKDDRDHARREHAQRDMRRALLPVLTAAPELRPRVLHRDASLRLLEEDDRRHRHQHDQRQQDDAEERDAGVEHSRQQRRNTGDDAAEDDQRDAVADALLRNQLTQPDQEHRARRSSRSRPRSVGSASGPVKPIPLHGAGLLEDQQLAVALDDGHAAPTASACTAGSGCGPARPSRDSACRLGIIGVMICMMIEAVMYG